MYDKNCNFVNSALIDVEDVEKCRPYKWHIRKSNSTEYAITSLEGNKKIHLHRFVLDYDGELEVDHKNRNGLDNRKENLR